MAVTLTALKSTRYCGRLYRKGESFKVESDRTARIYGTLGRARIAAETSLGDPMPSITAESGVAQQVDPLADLRAEYEALVGSAPDRRWGESRIRSEMADHRALAEMLKDDRAAKDAEPAA